MGNPLAKKSTMERISRDLEVIIKKKVVSLTHAPELDFTSSTFTMPNSYHTPVYNMTWQVQPETPGLPILTLRVYLGVACSRSGALTAEEADRQTMKIRDEIHRLIQDKPSQQNLGITRFTRINDATIVRGNAVISTAQFEFKAFARAGEY